jgi:hypothetical protein
MKFPSFWRGTATIVHRELFSFGVNFRQEIKQTFRTGKNECKFPCMQAKALNSDTRFLENVLNYIVNVEAKNTLLHP